MPKKRTSSLSSEQPQSETTAIGQDVQPSQVTTISAQAPTTPNKDVTPMANTNPNAFGNDAADASDGFFIDFSEIKELPPIADGKYDAVVIECKPGTSGTGNKKLDLRYRIEGGDFDGRSIYDTLSFHPDAKWRTKAVLAALGFEEGFKGAVTPEHVIGSRATITVKMEAGSGVNPQTNEPYPPRPRIKSTQPVGSATDLKGLLG